MTILTFRGSLGTCIFGNSSLAANNTRSRLPSDYLSVSYDYGELENFIILSINKTRLLIWDLKLQMFTIKNKKQPPEVFYKKAVLKSFSIFTGKHLYSSLFLFNQVASLQVCYLIKKRFQHRCFSVNIAKFLKTVILKKICKRLLLNNVKRNYSSMKTVK